MQVMKDEEFANKLYCITVLYKLLLLTYFMIPFSTLFLFLTVPHFSLRMSSCEKFKTSLKACLVFNEYQAK